MGCYIAIVITLVLSTANAYAADEAPIPGLEFLQLPADADIGQVLARLYIWGIGFVALAAFFMLTWGGVLYMIAGDKDPSDAKSKMRNAIYGLLLALGSYLILYTINPALVNIAKLELPPINQVTTPTTPTGQYGCKALNSFGDIKKNTCPGAPLADQSQCSQCEERKRQDGIIRACIPIEYCEK